MFKRKTVFILGAGASWHYNYPTGDDLVACVLEKIEILIGCYKGDKKRYERDLSQYHRTGQMSKIESICEIIQNEDAEYSEIIEFLQNFYDRLKFVNPPVIDYFFQSNVDLQEIGKLMVAWVILDRETEFLKSKRNMNRLRGGQKPHECKDDWYRYVLYKMLIGAESYKDVFKNELAFITFNYDVSLDAFLYKGLKQIEFMKPDRVSDDVIKDYLRKRIHHVYGFVREEDQFSEQEISFNPPNAKTVSDYVKIINAAHRASQSIDTIAGQKRNIPPEVLQKLETAQDIYVLGFGFDSMNCESLNANEYFGFNSSKKYVVKSDYRNFYFTNYGDYRSVTKRLHDICRFPNKGVFFSNWGDVPYEHYDSLGGER